MDLLLIRHGESIANIEGRMQGHFDSPLSERGREQARALAARLLREGRTAAAVYSSDLLRAAATAEILAAGLSAPLCLDARLREFDVGALTGVLWNEVEVLYPEVWQQIHEPDEYVRFPGEEDNQAFRGRLADMLAFIKARHSEADAVVVVSHGGSLGMLLTHLLGMDTRRPFPFRFSNASLSIVEMDGRRLRLSLLNDTCHLHGDLR
jgi:alpha-ribazole phosphatase/probable phosphoglycerate mutase